MYPATKTIYSSATVMMGLLATNIHSISSHMTLTNTCRLPHLVGWVVYSHIFTTTNVIGLSNIRGASLFVGGCAADTQYRAITLYRSVSVQSN